MSINWDLIHTLSTRPHPHLHLSGGGRFTCEHGHDHTGVGEVLREARVVQHLCDLGGIFCVECGARWPCGTRRMADGTHPDLTTA